MAKQAVAKQAVAKQTVAKQTVATGSVAGGSAAGPAGPAEAAEGRTSSRLALIEAAVEVFARRGYEAATVAEIAERAGVTTGALYAHFRGKLDLLLQSLGLQSVEEFAREALRGIDTTRHGDLVGALGRDMAAAPGRRSLPLLDVIVMARRDPRLAGTIGRLVGKLVDELVASTDRFVAHGVIDPGLPAADVARLVVTVAFGKMVMAALGEPLPSERAFVRIVDALLFCSDPGGDRRGLPVLAGVARAAAEARRARSELERLVRVASEAGHSLREIGEAAAVSHERIRRIVAGQGAPDPGP